MRRIDEPLRIYTIYDNPDDYPGRYVVRGASIGPGIVVNDPEPTAVTDTLDEARASVPEGLYRLDRAAVDEQAIVELWV